MAFLRQCLQQVRLRDCDSDLLLADATSTKTSANASRVDGAPVDRSSFVCDPQTRFGATAGTDNDVGAMIARVVATRPRSTTLFS